MKKIIVTAMLLFVSFITNAQELDGVWKFEKMKLFGYEVFFNGTAKDKENAINGYLKAVRIGTATDEEKIYSINGINENKALIYASFTEQYGYNLQFKDGKLLYKYLGDDGKMVKTEADLNLEADVLKLYSTKKLYDTFSFKYLVNNNKLKLIEINEMAESDEDVFIFFYSKKQ